MIDIIKNIEEIRKQKGIKQAEMGRRLGVSQTGYSNYVNRTIDMPFSRMSAIADALGVTLVDLITWPEKYVPKPEAEEICLECKQKEEVIENLNLLIKKLKQK